MLTIAVFGALWMFDTTALMRLTWYLITGGRDISPLWLLVAAGVLIAGWLVWRRGRSTPARGKKRGASRKAAKPRVAGRKASGARKRAPVRVAEPEQPMLPMPPPEPEPLTATDPPKPPRRPRRAPAG